MILFPEIDKKQTKKNVAKLLNTYRPLIRIVGNQDAPKITGTYFFEMKNNALQTTNSIETFHNRKRMAELELLKITQAMNQLDTDDRQLLYDKFMNLNEQTNIAIYMKYHMSESKFYREMDKALNRFAEAYGEGELLIEK